MDWRELLAPHTGCNVERMRPHRVVLCLQDTTELDLNGQTIEGLEPLSYEVQRGRYVHPTYAVSAGREPLGAIRFTVPAREGRRARAVQQQVWAQSVALGSGANDRVVATCLMAQAVGVPAGVEPMEWRSLTNREATPLEQAVELIDGHRARWEIEWLFHVFKNGCRVEGLQRVMDFARGRRFARELQAE